MFPTNRKPRNLELTGKKRAGSQRLKNHESRSAILSVKSLHFHCVFGDECGIGDELNGDTCDAGRGIATDGFNAVHAKYAARIAATALITVNQKVGNTVQCTFNILSWLLLCCSAQAIFHSAIRAGVPDAIWRSNSSSVIARILEIVLFE